MALLFQQWKLPVPEILMCIIGDDKITESNPKLAAVLSEGFTQVSNVLCLIISKLASFLSKDKLLTLNCTKRNINYDCFVGF